MGQRRRHLGASQTVLRKDDPVTLAKYAHEKGHHERAWMEMVTKELTSAQRNYYECFAST